jgi:ubiquinone/menaquinone biosynthesis C-methylase UbiE
MSDRTTNEAVKQTFDTVAPGYDSGSLRFFVRSAEAMAELLGLTGREQVLDVACGTGHATLAAAGRLPQGTVTAVDFSSGMLAEARKKAKTRGTGNVRFAESDMQDLPFPVKAFDAAICSFGIFFVADMEQQMAHIASRVRPGGTVMISCFHEDYFRPLKELLYARLSAYGVPDQPQAWKRIAQPEGCRRLFASAGLTGIQVEQRNVGYHLADAEEWWDIVWNAGWRRMVAQVPAEQQERFQQEHLEEVGALKDGNGIWLNAEVLYTRGTRPVRGFGIERENEKAGEMRLSGLSLSYGTQRVQQRLLGVLNVKCKDLTLSSLSSLSSSNDFVHSLSAISNADGERQE